MSISLQLSVRGKPSAWDISPGNEMCVVAAPGCLTFFHLNGLGAPRHVLHYEQPEQVRKLRYQRQTGGSATLAALRSGIVSLWDPSRLLRPLLALVQSHSPPGSYITDMQWSLTNVNLMATGSDCGGDVCLWDVRVPSIPAQAIQQPQGSVCTGIDWCPSQTHLLAVSNRRAVFIWDSRMFPLSGSGSASAFGSGSSSSGGALSHGAIAVLDTGRRDIGQFVWGSGDASNNCMVVGTGAGTLEW